MERISANQILLMIVLVGVSIAEAQDILLAPIPGLLPVQPLPGAEKCWSSLSSVPGCILEIFTSLIKGKITKIGPACCHAINEVSNDCWPKLLPSHPFFPPILKNHCSAPAPSKAMALNPVSENESVSLDFEIRKCWSSLVSVEGCVVEIFKSFRNKKIGDIGPACCKAIAEINDECWPKLFPFNPLFPPLLKRTCSKIIGGVAPPPITIDVGKA